MSEEQLTAYLERSQTSEEPQPKSPTPKVKLKHFSFRGGLRYTRFMSIEACVAHAIRNDLDVVEAFPAYMQCRIDEVEDVVEEYVQSLMD